MKLSLAEWGLRAGERFTYDYNFTAGWCLDLRVEHILPTEQGRVYPRCIGGRCAERGTKWERQATSAVDLLGLGAGGGPG